MADIAIFGIGPSGLAAGWAAVRAGHKVHFYSATTDKSTLYGCQYLHAPIPLPKEHARNVACSRVSYKLNGNAEQYRAKVYGDAWSGTVSPEDLECEHDAWDIRATYDALWDLLRQSRRVRISPAQINHNWIVVHTETLSRYSHVISTIPGPALCTNPSLMSSANGAHRFGSHTIWAAGSRLPEEHDSSEVVCDGTGGAAWYRTAVVFGYRTVEWPRQMRLAAQSAGAVRVRKPLYNHCDCHPEIIRLGRYGAWRKGVLVHHVYEDTTKLLEGSWVNQQW